MPPSSAGFASNNSVVSTRTGTAGNVDGSTMSFAGAGVGSRARSAGSRGGPKSKGVELMSNTHDVNVLRDSAQYRAEVEIEFQHLRKLLEIFQKNAASMDDNGEVGLTLDEFKKAFRNVLGGNMTDEQMTTLFMKIDTDTNETLDWDEFSAFILKRSEGKQIMEEEAQKRIFNHDPLHPDRPIPTPHIDIIKRIVHFQDNGRFMTVGRDGMECLWTADLQMIQKFAGEGKAHHKRGTQHAWVHDVASVPHLNMVVAVADDRTITLFDCNSMLPQMRIHLHEGMALCVAASLQVLEETSETAIYFGMDNGTLDVLCFDHEKLFSKKPSSECLELNIHDLTRDDENKLGSLTTWKAHSDWALGIKYIPDMNAVISCSSDEHNSIVIARKKDGVKWANEHASVGKGVQCFAYIKNPVAIVTGGQDRTLRIWNPHRIQKAIALMRGHSAPIIEVVAGIPGQCISLSWDKDIKLWDIRKQVCLQTIIDPRDYRPENVLGGLTFVPDNKATGGTLVVAGCTALLRYEMKEKHHDDKDPKSHEFPIVSALYNGTFDLCVSSDTSSAINVWEMSTGQKAYRWANAHTKASITAVSFDSRGRRLITGANDGTIKVWNHNNGMLLKEVKPPLNRAISAVKHIDGGEKKYFAAAAGKEVVLYVDEIGASSLATAMTLNKTTMGLEWHEETVTAVNFAPPSTLISGAADGKTCLVDVDTATLVHSLKPDSESKSAVKSLILVNIGEGLTKTLLSLDESGGLSLWDLQSGTFLGPLSLPSTDPESTLAKITAICTLPKTNVIAFGHSDGHLSLCTLTDSPLWLTPTHRWKAHPSSITSLDFADKHGLLVSVSNDTIKLWTLQGHRVGTFGERSPWDLERRKQQRELSSAGLDGTSQAAPSALEVVGADIDDAFEESHEEPEPEAAKSSVDVIGSLARIVPEIKPIDANALYHSMKVFEISTKYSASKMPSIFAIPNIE